MIATTDVPADGPCSPLEATEQQQPQQGDEAVVAVEQQQQQDKAVAVLQSDGALLEAAAGLGSFGSQQAPGVGAQNDSSAQQKVPARRQPAGNGCLQVADAAFMMFQYKTQPCNKVYTHDWAPCPFYHRHPAERARRRSPLTHSYAAVFCPEMDKLGKCPRGDMCTMSHSVFEYALHPDRFRTKICINGSSCTRTVCFYAHNPQELRRPSSTASSTQQEPPACSGAAAAAAGGQFNRSKPPMLPVVRVPAGQGVGMHAANQGPLSSNTSDSTACGMSWFGSSPLAPATPSSSVGLEGACQPLPPPPLAQGTQKQQQRPALMLRCQPQPQSVPFSTAQQGYGASQQGQQHMQRVPELSVLPSGPGSASAGPGTTVQHVQAQLAGLGVSAATAAMYAAPASSQGAPDAAAVLRPYSPNAGAQPVQHTGPLGAFSQWQPVHQEQQPAGGAGLGFGGAMSAEPAGGSTPGLVVCSGNGGAAPARLGVHAMLGMQQQQQGQQQGRVVYIQQQQPTTPEELTRSYCFPVGREAAVAYEQRMQQQLNHGRARQLLHEQHQQQQGVAGPGVSGIQPAGQFPPGIFYQQGYAANAGAAGSAATDSSLQPMMMQQPFFFQPPQQQQQQQQHLVMMPAGFGGGGGGMAGQGVQAFQGMGMGGQPGALAMQYGPTGY